MDRVTTRVHCARLAVLLCAAVTAGLVGLTAAANAAAPPVCQGILVTDPVGDAKDAKGGTAGVGGGQKAMPNEDLEAVYMNVTGGVVTVNLQIVNLDKKLGSGYTAGDGGTYYYAYFSFGGKANFVKAMNTDGKTITYGYGSVSNGAYLAGGSTKGSFTEGPHGVVSIEIPASIGGKPGDVLKGLFASAETIEGKDDFVGFNHVMDATVEKPTPDTPNGIDYTVKECPAGGGGGGGTAPAPTPPAPGGGGGGGGAQPGPTALAFKVPSTLGSVSKVKKAKALVFKATAGADVANLRLALKPASGGPAVGSLTVKLFRKGTTTLKMKVKKLTPGKYVLAAEGTVGGRQAGGTQTVTIKK